MPSVLLATLSRGEVSAHFCDSLADLLETPLHGVHVKHVIAIGGPMLAHTRNVVVQSFLSTPNDYLLFVDSDIKFTKDDLKILLGSGKDIIGARSYGYSQDRDEPYPNWKPLKEGNGLVECSYIGMNFTLMSRNFLTFIKVSTKDGWPFGYGEVDGLFAATEDILFCHRAREAGFQVFVHTDARVYHAKTKLV